MAKIKYYYDTETCRYEKAKVKKTDILLNMLGFLVFTLVLALGIAFAYNYYYLSPEEAQLKKENKELKQHYKILDKKVGEVEQIVTALQLRDDEIYRKIYEAEPLSASIRTAGIGGNDFYADVIKKGFQDKKVVRGIYERINKVKAKTLIQKQSYNELATVASTSDLSNIPSIQPILNEDLNKLASGFGTRIHPIHKGKYMHDGIDFASPRNTPVYATANGIIKLVKNSKDQTGYGNQIEIDHNNGYVTKYAHLESMNVKQGEEVKRGQIIGLVGNSGGSVAPHLHYEVIKEGKKVNPIFYMLLGLNEDQYHKLLKLSIRENQSFD
ncbi:MAG: peptidoglycan DD-metalloendopeptidase family protein [Candidatus Cyclobacteriaceae bacterium M2_1C_046]